MSNGRRIKENGVEIVCKEEAVACKPGTMLALAGDTEKNNEHLRQNIRSSGTCFVGDPPRLRCTGKNHLSAVAASPY